MLIFCSLRISRVTIYILVFCFLGYSAHAKNKSWPHLRGPKFNGHANAEDLQISLKQKFPIIWQVKVGQGYSGCIIANERLYTQAQNRSGQYVICIDILTGEELWRTRYGWPWELKGEYPGPYSTPTYSAGKIFFTGCYGTVGCLDSLTGKKIWTKDIQKDFGIQMPSRLSDFTSASTFQISVP